MTNPVNLLQVNIRALLLVACVLTQGCVGIGVNWTKTETHQNPSPEDSVRPDSISGPGVVDTNVTAYTAGWLDKNWGKPDSILHTGPAGEDEVWTYKSDL